MNVVTLPLAATISPALTGGEYSLIVAALRLLEDDMRDAGEPDALAIAAEAVALRSKLRSYADRAGRAADVVRL